MSRQFVPFESQSIHCVFFFHPSTATESMAIWFLWNNYLVNDMCWNAYVGSSFNLCKIKVKMVVKGWQEDRGCTHYYQNDPMKRSSRKTTQEDTQRQVSENSKTSSKSSAPFACTFNLLAKLNKSVRSTLKGRRRVSWLNDLFLSHPG